MEESKLSRYCKGVMEAAWLAAVMVTPLFFNVLSSRIFEPDKIAILRTLALIILGAWGVKLVEESHSRSLRFYFTRAFAREFLGIPLSKPILFLVVVSVIATIFSITPAISWLGSYERMQGTYTSFSYLVIFSAIAVHLRDKRQLNRLLTMLILSSFPVALYGILQKVQLDPVPWGSDVSRRISSSLGNSIFLAAYLIMVFPLTVGKIISSYRSGGFNSKRSILRALLIMIFAFIAFLQIIAIYLSGSRGPVLGWMAGLFFMLLVATIYWRKKWLTALVVGGALGGAIFLLLMNLAGGPFEALRASPAIGRFGLLLNAESNSALVRRYIWQGAVQLVTPHPPLEFPDGTTDRFNLLRPLLGYGPESMIVAYTPFYVPELGIVERRNATPDRAHNESWDAVVTGGLIGLVAYLWLFISLFYYGLKWMGLIFDGKSRRLFFILLGSASGLFGLFFAAWRGLAYLGVGIPFGLFLGLIGYIVSAAFWLDPLGKQIPEGDREKLAISGLSGRERFLILLVLMTAILAHFIEINFGIAISVTRLYFWVYTALLLVIGYLAIVGITPEAEGLPENQASSSAEGSSALGSATRSTRPGERNMESGNRRKSRKGQTTQQRPVSAREYGRDLHSWRGEAISGGLMLGIILVTLGYNFIGNPDGETSIGTIIWKSFTRIQDGAVSSAGILGLILATWLIGSIVISGEALNPLGKRNEAEPEKGWLARLGWCGGTAILVALTYWILHAGTLARIAGISAGSLSEFLAQVESYSRIFIWYVLFLVGMIFIMAVFLMQRGIAVQSKTVARQVAMSLPAGIAGIAMVVLVGYLALVTNLRSVQADMAFKLADTFARPNTWPVAIEIYQFANKLAPNQDYYYLYLGKAYLEQANEIQEESQVEKLFLEAEVDLKRAQSINPLNVDHTANLARLYSIWSSRTSDPSLKAQRLQQSEQLFQRALTMSPNNVRLWNEWAYLGFQTGAIQDGYSRLQKALELDPSFDWTYVQLGDYFQKQADQAISSKQRDELLFKAMEAYRKALSLQGDTTTRYNATISLGNTAIKLGRIDEAIQVLEKAVQDFPSIPTVWRIYETLARLYLNEGRLNEALDRAQASFEIAPAEQKGLIQEMIDQIRARQ